MTFFSVEERVELAEQYDRQCQETRRQLPSSAELRGGPNSEERQIPPENLEMQENRFNDSERPSSGE